MKDRTYITERTQGFPVLNIELDGFVYGLSVKDIPEAHREWLSTTFFIYMQQVHDRAFNKARREIRDGLRELLDL